MEKFEERGRSLEEAIQRAEESLGRKLRASEYTIKESGSRGVLGLIGARSAIIEVEPKESASYEDFGDERISGLAIQSAEDLLDHMGLPGSATLELSEGYYKVDLEMEED